VSIYSVAREFMERELAAAEARGDRRDARVIAERLCEVIEQEDFDECRRLDQPSPPIVSDGCV
jgi:hypothetical protein